MTATSYKMDADGKWVVMTPEEVKQDRIEGERKLQEKVKRKGHDCGENPEFYEFWEDGQRYHGWDCSICGDLIHTG